MAAESFLLAQFRDFYREVIRWKERIVRDPRAFRTASDAGQEVTAAVVWQSLVSLLERQAIAVRRSGGEYAAEVFKEAQYLMAALADEMFLHLDWLGRTDWQGNLVEQRLFGTHRAGDEVFRRIERILRSRDPLEVELARLYMMALALGFQGRYRGSGPEGAARVDLYRRQLYTFVTNEDPDAPREAKPLFPEAYDSTLEVGEGRRFALVSRWVLGLVLVLLLWIVVSHQVWRGLVSDMEPVVERVLSDAGRRAPSTP